METQLPIQAQIRRHLLRQAIPLVPSWIVCAWVLAFSSGIWIPYEVVDANGYPETIHLAWTLIGTVALGTVIYAILPFFGPYLASYSNTIYEPFVPGSDGAARPLVSFLRLLLLALLYLIVFRVAFLR